MANTAVRIAVLADASRARRELSSVGTAAEKQSSKLKALGGTLKTMGGLAVASFAAQGIRSSISAATDYQKAIAQSTVALRANAGASGQTVASLKQRAASIESTTGALLDESDVLKGQQTLLRAGIKGESAYARAAQITSDVAAARGQSFDSASKIVAKALLRPEKAAGALARQGVVLSKVQQDQITAFSKAGNTAAAQGVIMDALASKYRGAAQAAGGDSTAGFRRLKDTLEDTGRDIAIKLLPVAQQLATFLTNNQSTVLAVAGAVAVLATGALAVSAAMKIASAATALWSGVSKAATAAQWLWNASLSANPIGLIIIGVAALAVGIFLLVKHFDKVKAVAGAVFGKLKEWVGSTVSWVRSNWPILAAILTGPIGIATLFIVKKRDAILGLFRSIRDGVVGLFQGIGGLITSTLKSAVNIAVDLLNKPIRAVNAVSGKVPGMPKLVELPHLATGGIIRHRPGGQLIVAGEGRYDEAVVPLNGQRFGAVHNHYGDFIVNGSQMTPEDVFRSYQRWIRDNGVGVSR